MKRVGIILAVVAIGLTIGGYVFFNGERKTPVRYRTAEVERGSVISVVSATGTINPVVSVQVGTQVSGMVKSLHADFNTRVKAGDTVAVIDPEPFKARREQAASNLEMARSSVARAKAEVAQRKRERDRVQSLVEQQFVSQNDVDVALTNYESAEAQLRVVEAQVRQAEATLHVADLELKHTVIRSPVDGIVVARNVEVGQTVAASFATPNLFLIALDLTKMQVDTNVSESDIGGMTEGKDAIFTVDAYPGVQFSGTIRQVRLAPINVQNVVTYNVVVAVDNRELRLKPGMTANVSIVVTRRDQVLKIPNAALRFVPPQSDRAESHGREGTGERPEAQATRGRSIPGSAESGGMPKKIWKLGESGEPESLVIQTGISDGLWTEVLAGPVTEHDKVIVGVDALRGERRAGELPPGFGSGGGQRRPPRDRGL
jgi:HlyD family secretion protein